MIKKRVSIPKPLQSSLLYKSAKTCCVCRVPRAPVEIHHIDENPSNNIEENLIVICKNCHDEAHTKHKLSKNLDVYNLKKFKSQWEEDVQKRSTRAMLSTSNLDQAVWTFINHQRIPQIMSSLNVNFDENKLMSLESENIVDEDGLPKFKLSKAKPKDKSSLITIYDRFNWDESTRLHYFYADAVNRIISAVNPIELMAIWSKTDIKNILKPGSICFCMRGFYFKNFEIINNEVDKLVYATSKGIEIRFYANTRHMFGSSALYCNFTGHRFAAVLLLIKNILYEEKLMVIEATTLAMGTGFVQDSYHTPYILSNVRDKKKPS